MDASPSLTAWLAVTALWALLVYGIKWRRVGLSGSNPRWPWATRLVLYATSVFWASALVIAIVDVGMGAPADAAGWWLVIAIAAPTVVISVISMDGLVIYLALRRRHEFARLRHYGLAALELLGPALLIVLPGALVDDGEPAPTAVGIGFLAAYALFHICLAATRRMDA